jgi:protein transport protein SEC61 subunit gamma-like protein
MEAQEKISTGTRLKSFIGQCTRVWHLLKKPDKEEFTTIAKVSAIGLGIVGGLGFLIAVVMIFIHL